MNSHAEGSYWPGSSLVFGDQAGNGEEYENRSPLGTSLQVVKMLNSEELKKLFAPRGHLSHMSVHPAVDALCDLLRGNQADLVRELRNSTGFRVSDCHEILDSCLEFLRDFKVASCRVDEPLVGHGRSIQVVQVPWGTLAVILPQNAFLNMALLCLAHGIATGNRVILRAPSGSARMAAILGQLLIQSGWDHDSFSIVLCDGGDFVEAWANGPEKTLLHYMGGSDRAPSLLAKSFQSGKPCLIDGEGNTLLFVDEDQDPVLAAEIAWQGSIRYNGETCTSINGAIVHPAIDSAFRIRLRELAAATSCGLMPDQIGPLFRAGQAEVAEKRIKDSRGRVGRTGHLEGAMMPPTLVEDPDLGSELVTQGVFAPVLWVRPGSYEEFIRIWALNRFPLCAAVLSFQVPEGQAIRDLTSASRIVMNGDPSLESPFEPWGAYPPSGFNPVSDWGSKYLRSVQVDRGI